MIWYFSCASMPWAPHCFSSALWSDIRLALSDCCFISHAVRQPSKWQQHLHTLHCLSPCDKRHVSPSPIHLWSTSYWCQEGRLPHGCPSTSCREHWDSRSLQLRLLKTYWYFRTKTRFSGLQTKCSWNIRCFPDNRIYLLFAHFKLSWKKQKKYSNKCLNSAL